jgi:hypothetical protein
MAWLTRVLILILFLFGLPACAALSGMEGSPDNACQLTEPVWIKPPEDSAVLDPPDYSDYFVNEDRSIWASASWAVQEEFNQNVAGEWIKVGWFRPEGAELILSGERLDGQAPPMESEVPCCYPTRFQTSGLYFPTEGCWKVTARAGESELSFVVRIKP